MKLTFVLRNKKNALKLSTKTFDKFMERIITDTKDGAVARRRQILKLVGNADSYDREHPSHLIYPSALAILMRMTTSFPAGPTNAARV